MVECTVLSLSHAHLYNNRNMFLKPAVNVSPGFSQSALCAPVDGDVISPFPAPLVTKLYKFIRLSMKNVLSFIRIQYDKQARKLCGHF